MIGYKKNTQSHISSHQSLAQPCSSHKTWQNIYIINRITLTYSWCNIKHLILARVFKRGTTSTRLEKNSLHKTGKKLQKRTKVEKRWPKQSPDVDKIFTPWNFCPGIFIQMTVDSYFVGIALSFVLMRISKSRLRVSTGVYQLRSKILPWSGWGEGAVEGREGTWGERQEEEDQHVRVEAGQNSEAEWELRSGAELRSWAPADQLVMNW